MDPLNKGLKESLAPHDDDDEYRNWVPTNRVRSLGGKQSSLSRRAKILGCV